MGFKKESEKIIEKKITQEEKNENIEEIKEVEVNEETNLNLKEKIESYQEEVKIKQEELKKEGKKIKLINYIVTFTLLALLIAAFVIVLTIGKENEILSIVVLVLAILFLGGSFAITKIQKKKSKEISDKYAQYVTGLVNEIVYQNEGIEDISYSLESTESKELIKEFKVYSNIKNTKTLNSVKGKLLSNDFIGFDGAIVVLKEKKNIPYFLGKMYVFNLNNIDNDFKAIYQLKGKEYSYPVTKYEDFTLVKESDKESYLVNKTDLKEIIDENVIKNIKKFKLDKKLYDVTILISESKLFIALNYEDSIVNIPVENGLNDENISKVRGDLNKVIEIYKAINKR